LIDNLVPVPWRPLIGLACSRDTPWEWRGTPGTSVRRLILEWQRGGQPAREFAARRGFTEATLLWWRWRLGKAQGSRPSPQPVGGDRPAAAAGEGRGGPSSPAATTARWELETRDGLRPPEPRIW
jgi:hypothetical protein